MKLSERSLYISFVIIFAIAIDQVSKVLVRAYIKPGEQIKIIGEKFVLMNVENQGAFLGMGSELSGPLRIIVLLVLPLVVLAFVLRYIIKDKSLDSWSLFAFAAIIGGGIANVFDRIIYGSVTDFLYIKLTDLLRTGIFNIADLFVTTAIFILVFMSFRKKKG